MREGGGGRRRRRRFYSLRWDGSENALRSARNEGERASRREGRQGEVGGGGGERERECFALRVCVQMKASRARAQRLYNDAAHSSRTLGEA